MVDQQAFVPVMPMKPFIASNHPRRLPAQVTHVSQAAQRRCTWFKSCASVCLMMCLLSSPLSSVALAQRIMPPYGHDGPEPPYPPKPPDDPPVLPLIDIEPDANMSGVVGDVVKSAKAASTVEHFVTPKKTTELAQEYVELKAVGVDTATFRKLFEWEGGEAGSTVEKRKVKRDVTGKIEVKIKTKQGGAVSAQMNVWVVWWDVIAQKVVGPTLTRPYVDGEDWTRSSVLWHFEATVQPVSILAKTDDIPDMTGINATQVSNAQAPHALDGGPFGDATYKWDFTRRCRRHSLMPSITANDVLWPRKGLLSASLPAADKIFPTSPASGADHYPSEPTEGNDDTQLPNADVDVYAPDSGEKLLDDDQPRNTFRDGAGAIGDIVDDRMQFQQFVRGEINGKWYRVSNYSLWRNHTKLKKVDEAVLDQDFNGDGDKTDKLWIDDGSASDSTNTGF